MLNCALDLNEKGAKGVFTQYRNSLPCCHRSAPQVMAESRVREAAQPREYPRGNGGACITDLGHSPMTGEGASSANARHLAARPGERGGTSKTTSLIISPFVPRRSHPCASPLLARDIRISQHSLGT